MGTHHTFHVGGAAISFTPDEMKEIADAWWEHYGKSGMEKFFAHYRDKAAENIRTALGHHKGPESEDAVKGAIAQAFVTGDPSLIAEVFYEATEWETAHSALESIGD